MYIDTHVHCRDWAEKREETISHALEVAEEAGVDAIFDMPNTHPSITTRRQVEERLELADSINSKVFYGLYIGLTSDQKQVREAVRIHKDLFPRVVGLKLFAGKSVGDLGVISEEDQRGVYGVLGNNYKGVLVVHCEKESLLRPDLWDPSNPISHTWARPLEAEVESIKDQVLFCCNYEFRGNLHIAHVSTPESVKYIGLIRKNLGLGMSDYFRLRISCGVTPHHLFLHDAMMNEKNGLLLKVNPPLRSKSSQEKLLEDLRENKINWIESDHAPHTLDEKLGLPYMSGVPGLHRWPRVVSQLKGNGFSEEQIANITFNNALSVFGMKEHIKRIENIGDVKLGGYDEYDVFYS